MEEPLRWLGATALLVACRSSDDGPANVLVLVLDDLGTDQIAAYAQHPDPPATPTLDGLVAGGVRFDAAYSYPVCSAARSALLTGRMGRRTGIGDLVDVEAALELPEDEVLLPEALRRSPDTWSTAAIGKWHLAGGGADQWRAHALRQGFDTHRGSPGNVGEAWDPAHGSTDYYRWERLEDGVLGVTEQYATTVAVDDALSWLGDAQEPWLAWVGFNAAHGPYQAPPAALAEVRGEEVSDRYRAMVTALDAEIGRLLEGLDPDRLERTLVIVVGDNGTPGEVVRPPSDPSHAKGTLYEGGIRVPLIVSGAGVVAPGRSSRALVHGVDLFPTILASAGVDPATLERRGAPLALDGHSLWPLLEDPAAAGPRTTLVTEMFSPAGPAPHRAEGFAVRDEAWKLMELRLPGLPVETHLFDLRGRWDDGPDLWSEGELTAEAEAASARLRSALLAFEALPYDGL